MYFRVCRCLLLAFAAVLLSSCAVINGPRTVLVPTETLQASLAQRFPLDMRYSDLFDLHISNPTLAMLPALDRAAVTMDVVLAPPFLKRTWKGTITLSGVLKPDGRRRMVVLGSPRLDAFRIEGFDPELSRQISEYGSALAEQVLRNVPVVSYDDLPVPPAFGKLEPTGVNATAEGLQVTFSPVP